MRTPPALDLGQIELNREKYLKLVESSGVDAAVTQLHKDLWELENQTMEGHEGFQSQLWDALNEYRKFSAELWAYGRKRDGVL